MELIQHVRDYDHSFWEIGDALLLDGADGSTAQFKDCARALWKLGFSQYGPNYLRQLWETAVNFPASARRPDLSWSIHQAAGTPENLARILDLLHELNWPVTQDHVAYVAAYLRNDHDAMKGWTMRQGWSPAAGDQPQ